ncbi:MAG: hypothetical protein GY898_29190 [Proteobacteria bacterium]|nr:hypothetical protein [Pseudomonadota bacterium]
MSASDGPLRSRGALLLAAFVGVAFARCFYVWQWAPAEIGVHRTYATFPAFLIEGVWLSPAAHLPEEYQGCALVWGLLCAPVFAAGGPIIASMQWYSLLWHSAMAIVFVAIADAGAGRKAAWCVTALFVFAPPAMAEAAGHGIPDHMDAGLLTGLSALAFLAAAKEPTPRSLALAGFGAGGAVYFMVDALLAVAAMVGVAMLVGQIRSARSFAIVAGGAVVGSLPYLLGGGAFRSQLMRETLNSAPDRFAGAPSGAYGLRGLPSALAHSMGFDDMGLLSFSAQAGDAPMASLVVLVTLACLAIAGLLCAPDRAARRTSGASCAVVFAHLSGVALSGISLLEQYLTPVLPWLLVGAGVGIAQLSERRARGVGLIAGGGLLVICMSGLWAAPSRSSVERRAEPERWVNARNTPALHLLSHPRLPSVLGSWGPARRRALALRTPSLIGDLARIEGRVRGEDWVQGLEAREAFPGLGGVSMLLGLGEALVYGADDGTPGTLVGKTHKRWAGRLPRLSEESDRFVAIGVSRALWERYGPEPGWIEESPVGVPLQALCIGLGLHGIETDTTEVAWSVQASVPSCTPEAVAVGVALGLSTIRRSGGPHGTPNLMWWTRRPAAPTVAAAFECALTELARTNSVDGSEVPEIEACLRR